MRDGVGGPTVELASKGWLLERQSFFLSFPGPGVASHARDTAREGGREGERWALTTQCWELGQHRDVGAGRQAFIRHNVHQLLRLWEVPKPLGGQREHPFHLLGFSSLMEV